MKDKALVNWLASRPLWPFNLGAIASGPFLLRDSSAWAEDSPKWAGPIELIPWGVVIVFATCLISIAAIEWGRMRTRASYKKLQERADRAQELEDTIALNISEIITGIIGGFGRQLKLQPDDNSRLSLYVDNGSSGLLSIGRWGTNPNYESVGRKVLPKDLGCVGLAWAESWVFEGDFGTENYDQHPSHHGMAPDVIAELKMKPRYLAALRIDDSSRKLAVLVFESMQADRFEERKIKREMIAFSEPLTDTLNVLTPHLPRPIAGEGEEL